MLRNLPPIVLFTLLVSLAPFLRADEAADDQAFFDRQTSKFIKLQPQRLTGDAVGKVFNAILYKVSVVNSDGGSSNAVVARKGDDIAIVTIPSTTTDMPDLVKLLKSDFTLKSDADAQVFQDALDTLYPIDTTFNKDDLNAKGIRHDGNQWTFVRGKFFDHFKGFIVTTDVGGKVTGVKWTLDDIK